MKGKHLDEQIRKALENLEINFDPGSWNAFEERLDAASSDAADPLDQLVTDRLAGFEVPLHAGDWDKMQQRIEAEETAELIENEAYIDNLAYEKLRRMEAPFQHSHWHLMAKRLEEEFSLRHQLYRYKVAECVLVALFLLTIIRFAPLAGELLQGPSPENNAAPAQQSLLPGQSSDEHQPANGQTTVEKITAQTAPATSAKAAAPADKQSATPFTGFKKTAKEAIAATDAQPESGNRTIGHLPETNALSLLQTTGMKALAMPFTLEEMLSGHDLWQFPSADSKNSSAETLADIQPGPVYSKYAWEVPQVPVQVFEKEKTVRFSLFTTTDFSYVFTPSDKLSVFDTLVPTDPDTTLASGYGGGILISWKKDRWEFQTGGIYSFKRYIPNTPVFLFETVSYYIREEFHGVQLDLLEIPLNLQYHFKNRGKWRIYGNGGISGHFITSSVYEIKHQRTPTFKLAAAPGPEGDVLEDNTTIRNEKEFPAGLFDGGNLRSNLFLTANIGLGVERYVSPRWSLFFQPNYQHFLMSEGVGTNKDKFYTVSFNLGTKVSLK